MNKQGVEQMQAVPGGTPEQPQATAVAELHEGELVNGASGPPRLSPAQWQTIMTAFDLLRTHEGRIATALYEVSRDDVGCVHIIIGRPQGT
jgi:hypothetical protein